MKLSWSSLKNRVSEFADAFTYRFELLRGYVIDPFESLFHRCHLFFVTLIHSKTGKGIRDVHRLERRRYQYCLSGTRLSFYDTFTCVNGVPAFLLTKANPRGALMDQSSSSGAGMRQSDMEGLKNKKQRTKFRRPFASQMPNSVRQYAFSVDSTRFAVCYANGEVSLWDTDHGTLLETTPIPNIEATLIPNSEASAVSFLNESNTVLLICTQDCKCWKWNVDSNVSEVTEFLDIKEVSEIPGEVFLRRTDFFMNGTILVLSTIANYHRGCELSITVVNTTTDPLELQTLSHYPVSKEENFVISEIALSPDRRGILVGLIDEGMEDSFCVLWPNFKEESSLCHKLRIGTVGSWSLDSKYVVTWTMIGTSNYEDDNGSSAFIWNVKEMRQQLENHEYSLGEHKETITNPFTNQVFWCYIVEDMDQKSRLIMGIAGESVRFLYWDLESKIHTHTIETKISSRDMILFNREAWIEAYVEKMSVKGLSPITLDKAGCLFGAVLGWPSEVFVWDVQLGVEVFKVSPRDLQDNDFKGGIDIIGSPSCEKFAIIRNNGVMVFCPSVLTKCEHRDQGISKAQMVELEHLNISHRHSNQKMTFSGDGNTLVVLCVGSSKMQVWNLVRGTSCTIDATFMDGGSIRNFCLSHNGEHLATYIGKNIQIWKYEAKEVNQPIAKINIDFEVEEMGIKNEALEIILCIRDGTIFIYHVDEIREESNFDDKPTTSYKNLFRIDNREQRARVPRDDLEPLITKNSSNIQDLHDSLVTNVFNQKRLSYKKHVLCEAFQEATFQVCPSFKTVIRISDSEKVEMWNLETKIKIKDKAMDVERIKRSSEIYSRASSVSGKVSDKLLSGKGIFFDGTSITRTKQTTVVQSTNEHIVVAANSPSSGLVQRSYRTSYDIEYEEDEHEDSHSVYIINLNDIECKRRLSGKDLDPGKGLAISNDGRYVACFAGDHACKIVVWNAYACENLLPDYHYLVLNGAIGNKEVIKKEIIPMIDFFGANFFQFRHPNGMSILDEAIWYFNNDLLKTILQFAHKKDIKLSFLFTCMSNFPELPTKHASVIDVAIDGKSPHTLKVMLKYLLKRVTHETEIVTILGHSLKSLAQDYPHILVQLLRDFKLSGLGNEVEVLECYFEKCKFIAHTYKSLNLSQEETIKCWQEKLKHYDENNQSQRPIVKAVALTLPIEGACNIGKSGLLHDLLIYRAHHSAFDSFVVQAIVEYKWEKYARKTLIHELLYHCLLSVSFTIYCFFLCDERTYKLEPEDKDGVVVKESAKYEENSTPTIISLIICCVLIIPCLIREFRQCGAYIINQGLLGFLHWLTSAWNWMEVLSYFNVVLIIPLGEFLFLNKGAKIPLFSDLVAAF